MNKINRDKILEVHGEQIGSYIVHLNILKVVSIIISLILGINSINRLSNGNNIFDIYNNPLLYYSIFTLLIIVSKLWALYNFKKIGIYIVYTINGLIQIIITVWFVIAVVVSFLANIIITALVLAIFACVSIVNISLIVYYHKIRDIFIY